MTGASRYRFASPAQKAACLTTGLPETLLLDPAGGEPMTGLPEGGVRLLAVAPDGEPFAVDVEDRLCAGAVRGPVVAQAKRLVAGRRRIWVLAEDGLHQFDRRSLHRLLRLDADDTVDIAAADDDAIWRLGDARIEHWSANGRATGAAFDARERARAMAAAGGTLLLLSRDSERLELIDAGDGRSIGIDLFRLMAEAGPVGGDPPDDMGEAELVQGRDKLLLRRRDREGRYDYLVLDGEGSVAARGRGERLRPIALAGDDLVAAFGEGKHARRFTGAAGGDGARWLTPAMTTGSHGGGWIRAEIEARLPEGATLSLRWAALPDEAMRESVEAVQADRSRSRGDRLAAANLLLEPYWSPEFTYTGPPAAGGGPAATQCLAFPLDKEAGPVLWIYLKLRRNDAARAPAIDSLNIYHGEESLIDHLPAIFRGSGDADGTLRRLVGVLEATTHGIDRTIAALAARLDPERTDERWLPLLAATLGLPFDEALTPAMRRRIVGAAGALLVGRGTRGGLAALFEALFPKRRVRIVDRTAHFLPAALGGGGVAGSRLPAMLAGPSRRAPRLGARLVLGATPLSPADGDGALTPMPEILVSIPATGGERRRFGAAARQMAEAMVPAGVRLRLRWTPWRGHAAAHSDWLALADDPAPLRIGEGRVGHASVGGRRDPRVEGVSLGSTGHRLL